jgi:hypothetical protein
MGCAAVNTKPNSYNSIPDIVSFDHMTHISNLDSILARGLQAHNTPFKNIDISDQKVNSYRQRNEPLRGRSIHSYVPFYINARNAMLYRVQRTYKRAIIILGYDIDIIRNAIVTDGNAACYRTKFMEPAAMEYLDWNEIQSNSWYNNVETKRKMMAEVLVPHTVPSSKLKYIFCQDIGVKVLIESTFDTAGIQVLVTKSSFF